MSSLAVKTKDVQGEMPSSLPFSPDYKDLPIQTYLQGLENLYQCKIDFRTNREKMSEINVFLLGDTHTSKLHSTVNTLFVRVFAKAQALVFHEGQEGSLDRAERPMIDKKAVRSDLHFRTWDCMEKFDPLLMKVQIHQQQAGILATRLLKWIEHPSKDPEQYRRELQTFDQAVKVLLNELENEPSFRLRAEHNVESTEALDETTKVLKQVMRYAVFSQDYFSQLVDDTFSSRQASLIKNIKLNERCGTQVFYLAGKAHLTNTAMEFEPTLKPVMMSHPEGYLAISLNKTSPDNLVQEIEESMPNFDFEKGGYDFCSADILLGKLWLELHDKAYQLEKDAENARYRSDMIRIYAEWIQENIKDGFTSPIFTVIEKGNPDLVEFCFDAGAELKTQDDKKRAILKAQISKNMQILELVLARGCKLSPEQIATLHLDQPDSDADLFVAILKLL